VKVAIVTTIRLLAVTILYFISFAVVSGALLAHIAPNLRLRKPVRHSGIVSRQSVKCSSLELRHTAASWTSWRLILTIFLVFYGVTTLMPQIETSILHHQSAAGHAAAPFYRRGDHGRRVSAVECVDSGQRPETRRMYRLHGPGCPQAHGLRSFL
jgi:hypothetical protein